MCVCAWKLLLISKATKRSHLDPVALYSVWTLTYCLGCKLLLFQMYIKMNSTQIPILWVANIFGYFKLNTMWATPKALLITDENLYLHNIRYLSPVLENWFADRYKLIVDILSFSFNTAWKCFISDPHLNTMSTQKDITGHRRFVQGSRSGIEELRPLKSHWLLSAVINYERQSGWCSQMKQNMFGCAAQPPNDAGKQKDNCPLRWLGKSF